MLERAHGEVVVLERAFGDTFTAAERAALCDLLDRATVTLARQTPRVKR